MLNFLPKLSQKSEKDKLRQESNRSTETVMAGTIEENYWVSQENVNTRSNERRFSSPPNLFSGVKFSSSSPITMPQGRKNFASVSSEPAIIASQTEHTAYSPPHLRQRRVSFSPEDAPLHGLRALFSGSPIMDDSEKTPFRRASSSSMDSTLPSSPVSYVSSSMPLSDTPTDEIMFISSSELQENMPETKAPVQKDHMRKMVLLSQFDL